MITVLLSVYNGEEWLKECIESILDQTYRNFEFLIIDDGSTDKSLSIIKKYAYKDSRIVYFSHSNIGLTECGHFFCFSCVLFQASTLKHNVF